MRKIDRLAQEKFNGDIQETIKYLLHNSQSSEFHEYINEMTEAEASYTLDCIEEHTIEKVGGIENYKALYKREEQINSLNMTFEEVRDAKTNPFKKKLIKSLIGMFIIQGLSISLMLLGDSGPMLGTIVATSSGLWAMAVASNLIDFLKFKKVKKSVDREVMEGKLVPDKKRKNK